MGDSAEFPSIEDFLGRPRIVTTYTALATATSIAIWDITAQAFLMNIPMYMNKVEGFKGFRADIVFRLTVANTPFVPGRIRMVHLPYNDRETPYSRLTKAQISQMKGVELDINTQTSAEFTIPYESNYPYFDLTTGIGGWGTLNVYQYLPSVVPTNSTVPKLTLWYYFKNVKLSVPTSPVVSNIVPQAGRTRKLTMNPEERQDGIVSGILSRTAKITDYIGASIPSLSAYVVPISWIARTGAKVAASFGFSKPLCDMPAQPIRDDYARYVHNCDGVDQSHNLALCHDSKVPVMPGFAGVDVDEMAISYLCRIPCCIGTVSLGSQVSGTLIYSCYLAPDAMWYQNGAFNKTLQDVDATLNAAPFPAFVPSPLCMVGQMFEKYRGGFYFTLKFAKTAFHAGRLLVAFNPVGGLPGSGNSVNRYAVPSYANTLYIDRAYIDLKEESDFTFHVPYRSFAPYLPTCYGFGTFNIYVVDPLVSTGDVSSTINFVVEVAGDEGFHFAQPTASTYVPVLTSPNIVAQAGPTRMGKDSDVAELDIVANTVAERIFSLKQLLLKPYWFDATTFSTFFAWTNNQPTFTPNQAAATAVSRGFSDHIDFVASMFALRRGGMVLRSYSLLEAWWIATFIPKASTDDRAFYTSKKGCTRVVERNNMLNVYVPPYNPSFAGIIRNKDLNDVSTILPGVEVSCFNASGTSVATYNVTRVFADDAIFGGFISTPLLVRVNDTVT